MKMLKLTVIAIVLIFVEESITQDNNIGIWPADFWSYDCNQDNIAEDVPPYLAICVEEEQKNCILNVSAPTLYWLTCEGDYTLATTHPSTCDNQLEEKCEGITWPDDPTEIIYGPLYHPEEKVRMYPEIFDAIRDIDINYIKGYVKMLRKTFRSAYYSEQYNYQWQNEDEDE